MKNYILVNILDKNCFDLNSIFEQKGTKLKLNCMKMRRGNSQRKEEFFQRLH